MSKIRFAKIYKAHCRGATACWRCGCQIMEDTAHGVICAQCYARWMPIRTLGDIYNIIDHFGLDYVRVVKVP